MSFINPIATVARFVHQLADAVKPAVTHTVHVTGGRFDSIGAGVNTPVELLSSPRMAELLVRARHHYDYVLLDAPSFPLLSDALMLTRYSDFVLSVIRLGNTPRKLAEEHVRAFSGKQAGHALVVNATDVVAMYGYPEYAGGAAVLASQRGDDRVERTESDSHLQ